MADSDDARAFASRFRSPLLSPWPWYGSPSSRFAITGQLSEPPRHHLRPARFPTGQFGQRANRKEQRCHTVKRSSFLLVVTAALPAAAQVSVSAPNGIDVHMTARMEPGSAQVPSAVRTTASGSRFHRLVLDRSQRRYFAYDLLIEAKDGSQALQVRFEPFSLSGTELAEMQMVDPSWTPIAAPEVPLGARRARR